MNLLLSKRFSLTEVKQNAIPVIKMANYRTLFVRSMKSIPLCFSDILINSNGYLNSVAWYKDCFHAII